MKYLKDLILNIFFSRRILDERRTPDPSWILPSNELENYLGFLDYIKPLKTHEYVILSFSFLAAIIAMVASYVVKEPYDDEMFAFMLIFNGIGSSLLIKGLFYKAFKNLPKDTTDIIAEKTRFYKANEDLFASSTLGRIGTILSYIMVIVGIIKLIKYFT